ncbi:MAG: TrbI/VirB10 family protein [Halobacteriovoraceae bacterium]|nr:TrbI/VirB10 family protein [Halobacteriovoraceae bacterium]MCB9093442.1 TrbI/VirB10 family protein [Halobacteriovoraceae bacterium]
MEVTQEPLADSSNIGTENSDASSNSKKVQNLLDKSSELDKPKPRRLHSGPNYKLDLKYEAKQVIARDDVFDTSGTIPIGTNLIGKLLTSIDTREMGQLYKVLLPYGGKFKEGGEIPKGTVLFGKVNYPGRGEKVFLKFEKGVLPEGEEIEIHGQALTTSDYSPGIIGDFHGKAGTRLATTLGLTMFSGMTEILTEKEALGKDGISVAPKATMKNAFYGGLSKASQAEAERQAQELNQEPEYVTVDAGVDLIVNLTQSYRQR